MFVVERKSGPPLTADPRNNRSRLILRQPSDGIGTVFPRARQNRSRSVIIYLMTATAGNLIWEAGQLPLYTLWWSGTKGEILKALLHCTGGDALIAAAGLIFAAAVAQLTRWAFFGRRMIAFAIMFGIAYTIVSEWLNVEIRRSWAYTPSMPVFPVLGTGLAPMLQWLIVPAIAFALASRSRPGEKPPRNPPTQSERF